jgi:hypothetical protein
MLIVAVRLQEGATYRGSRPSLRLELVRDDDMADGHAFDAVLRRVLGRDQFDQPFLFVRPNRNDDLVGRKGGESVTDGKTDVCFARDSISGLAWKPLGRAFRDSLRLPERFLVAGEPVEYALPCDWHHDLDRVGLAEVRPQEALCVFDRADHEDVLAHGETVAEPGFGRS